MNMYTQQDYDRAAANKNRFFLIMGIISAVMIAVIVVTVIYRIEWAASLATALWLCVCVMAWGLQGRALSAYAKYAQRAANGPSHTYQGVFKSIEDLYEIHEKIPAYKVQIQEGEFMRTTYWDVQKGRPEIVPEQEVTFVTQGYFLIYMGPATVNP